MSDPGEVVAGHPTLSTDRDERLRRAEKAVRQGRIDIAIAEYLALVQEQPGDLSLANALGDLYVRAGRSPDAVPFYLHVADAYLREGFFSKAAGFYKKILRLAPDDEAVALRLADALAQQGLLVEARAQLRAIEHARRRRGEVAGAAEIVAILADLEHRDVAARLEATRSLVRAGDPRGVERLRAVVDDLRTAGHEDEALEVLRELVAAAPGDLEARLELAEALAARGEVGAALALLGVERMATEPRAARRVIELVASHGTADETRAAVSRWAASDPDARADLASAVGRLAIADPARHRLVVETCVDAAMASADAPGAARLIRHELASRPLDVAWSLKLVDVCVDGELDEVLGSAQADLAEAYVAAGQLAEARVVLEDLLLREPDDEDCRQRLTVVLTDLGVADPVAAIDGLLALSDDSDDQDEDVEEPEGSDVPADVGSEVEEDGYAAPEATRTAPAGSQEVDLTARLGVRSAADAPGAEPDHGVEGEGAREPAGGPATLDEVFEQMRATATPLRGTEGRRQLALGRTYLAAGMTEEALATFHRAALDTEARAAAAVAIGEVHEEQENLPVAIEWFERGADAGESPEADRADAMRHLGEALEAIDEPARALAVWMELLTLRPNDRQASRHVLRLSANEGR